MPQSVTQLELNKKCDRYNYRITQHLRSPEYAAAVLKYIKDNRGMMPFTNGMGYSLNLNGSELTLVTNRCACEIGKHRCLTREMEGDERRMVCDVFAKAIREAADGIAERIKTSI